MTAMTDMANTKARKVLNIRVLADITARTKKSIDNYNNI